MGAPGLISRAALDRCGVFAPHEDHSTDQSARCPDRATFGQVAPSEISLGARKLLRADPQWRRGRTVGRMTATTRTHLQRVRHGVSSGNQRVRSVSALFSDESGSGPEDDDRRNHVVTGPGVQSTLEGVAPAIGLVVPGPDT